MADERRDYSDVTYPWDDDPNWAAPREGATSDPGDKENWTLECDECALRFPMDYTVENIGEHWKGHFPDAQIESSGDEKAPDSVRVNLVWIGLGTPPEPPADLMG